MNRPTNPLPKPRRVPVSRPQDTRRALLLLTGTPREILARLVRGDPLGLRPEVEQALRRRALLFDAPTVLRRSLVVVARRAPTWRGRPSLARWLKARVEEALDQLLEQDPEPRTGTPDSLAELGRPLGLDGVALRRARARFHRLDRGARASFLALVVEGEDLDRLARRSRDSASDLARAARKGLAAWYTATLEGGRAG